MIKLYSTHCPKCKILEMKLGEKNIQYEIITDEEIMESLGFTSMPMLEVDGQLMDFMEAITWVKQYGY